MNIDYKQHYSSINNDISSDGIITMLKALSRRLMAVTEYAPITQLIIVVLGTNELTAICLLFST